MRTLKTCTKCRQRYDESGFFYHVRRRSTQYAHCETHNICKACEQDARDRQKDLDPWAVKARTTRDRHARSLKIPVRMLTQQYGWTLDRMARDAQNAYENPCPYCEKPIKEMKNGRADLTLDVIRRGTDPFYCVNTKWCCATCNREKARKSAEDWAAYLASWQIWKEWKRTNRPPEQLIFPGFPGDIN